MSLGNRLVIPTKVGIHLSAFVDAHLRWHNTIAYFFIKFNYDLPGFPKN